MFPSKWYDLKLSNPQVVQKWYALKLSTPSSPLSPTLKWSTLCITLPSQMVRFKIVEPSSGPLCACFPRKWYALKLRKSQVVHFVHVSLANGTPWTYRTLKSSTLSMFPRKWYALKLFNPQAVHFVQCFPRKWYALKVSNPQVVHFVHFSLANGTP